MSKESKIRTTIQDITPLSPTTAFTYAPEYRQILFNMRRESSYSEAQMRDSFEVNNGDLYYHVDSIAKWKDGNGDFGKVYMLGGLLMYRYLESEAKLREGTLPTIRTNVIERYERDRFGDIAFEKLEDMRKHSLLYEADDLEKELGEKSRPHLFFDFTQLEPDIHAMIHMQCRTLIPLVEDTVFDGAMEVYFPFKVNQELERIQRMIDKKVS